LDKRVFENVCKKPKLYVQPKGIETLEIALLTIAYSTTMDSITKQSFYLEHEFIGELNLAK